MTSFIKPFPIQPLQVGSVCWMSGCCCDPWYMAIHVLIFSHLKGTWVHPTWPWGIQQMANSREAAPPCSGPLSSGWHLRPDSGLILWITLTLGQELGLKLFSDPRMLSHAVFFVWKFVPLFSFYFILQILWLYACMSQPCRNFPASLICQVPGIHSHITIYLCSAARSSYN